MLWVEIQIIIVSYYHVFINLNYIRNYFDCSLWKTYFKLIQMNHIVVTLRNNFVNYKSYIQMTGKYSFNIFCQKKSVGTSFKFVQFSKDIIVFFIS